MTNPGFRLVIPTSCRSSVPLWKRNVQNIRWAVRRSLHSRRELPYSLEDGLGKFLPAAALRVVAVDYHEGLLQRLNEKVRGTAEESRDVAQTVISTALDRSKTLVFNYASLALNNNFFLDQLKPPPPPPETTHEAAISSSLLGQIRLDHGGLEQLKSNFCAAALGMASSGWIWFVTDANGKTAVLPTFGSGTLLVRSRMHFAPELAPVIKSSSKGRRREELSQSLYPSLPFGSSPTSPTSGLSYPAQTNPHPNQSRSFRSSTPTSSDDLMLRTEPSGLHSESPFPEQAFQSRSLDLMDLGETLYPLFCISVHEHAWMSAGYGVWGKEEWLKTFWTVVDWGKVSANFHRLVVQHKEF